MFLKVETARQGVVKGESADAKHPNEIDVVSWRGNARADRHCRLRKRGQSHLNELSVVKRIDSGLHGVDGMRCATTSSSRSDAHGVRKAGNDPLEYLKITIQNARITALELQTVETEVGERLSFRFQENQWRIHAAGRRRPGTRQHDFRNGNH